MSKITAETFREQAAALLNKYASNAEDLSIQPPEEGFEDRREEFQYIGSILRALALQIQQIPIEHEDPVCKICLGERHLPGIISFLRPGSPLAPNEQGMPCNAVFHITSSKDPK